MAPDRPAHEQRILDEVERLIAAQDRDGGFTYRELAERIAALFWDEGPIEGLGVADDMAKRIMAAQSEFAMSDESPPEEAERRRDEALKRMLKTPPQPRKKGREPKPAPDVGPNSP